MGKPKMYGMNKPYTPNAKADRKRSKPFGANKGNVKNGGIPWTRSAKS